MAAKNVVEIVDDEARVGTFLIAKGFGKEHRMVLELVKKYRSDFEDFSRLKRKKSPSTGGRPVEEFLLNEEQVAFLGALFRNNPQVIKFKKKLVKEFFKMRRILDNVKAQHKDPEWLKIREKGKIARLAATDEIKTFEAYATEQGSTGAHWYYVNLTKMLNSLLFIVNGKFTNIRLAMDPIQLMITTGGDLVIKKALVDGMKKQLFYKEIYRLAKERVEIFAELHGQSEILSQQLSLFDAGAEAAID